MPPRVVPAVRARSDCRPTIDVYRPLAVHVVDFSLVKVFGQPDPAPRSSRPVCVRRVGRIAVSSRLRSGGSAVTEGAWGFAPGRNWGPEPPGGRVPNFPASPVGVQVLEDEVPPGVECGSSLPGSAPFRAQVRAAIPVRRRSASLGRRRDPGLAVTVSRPSWMLHYGVGGRASQAAPDVSRLIVSVWPVAPDRHRDAQRPANHPTFTAQLEAHRTVDPSRRQPTQSSLNFKTPYGWRNGARRPPESETTRCS